MKHIGRLEITQELYLGQMTTAERDALTPVQVGAVIYNTDTNEINVWNSTTWDSVTGGGGGGATNLATVPTATDVTVTSDSGTDATIGAATLTTGTNQAGLFLPTEKDKLALITVTGPIDLDDVVTDTLNSGQILVGNGSNVATGVAMSGDVTIDNAGVTTVVSASQTQAGKVEFADLTETQAGSSFTLAVSPGNASQVYLDKTIINTKGDVIFGSADNTATILPASGNDGAILIEDSTTISGWNNMRNNYAATTAPTATNDSSEGYRVGSVWVDTTGNAFYICVDNTATAAIWVTTGAGTDYNWTETSAVAAATTASGTNREVIPVNTAGNGDLTLNGSDYNAGDLVTVRNLDSNSNSIAGDQNFNKNGTSGTPYIQPAFATTTFQKLGSVGGGWAVVSEVSEISTDSWTELGVSTAASTNSGVNLEHIVMSGAATLTVNSAALSTGDQVRVTNATATIQSLATDANYEALGTTSATYSLGVNETATFQVKAGGNLRLVSLARTIDEWTQQDLVAPGSNSGINLEHIVLTGTGNVALNAAALVTGDIQRVTNNTGSAKTLTSDTNFVEGSTTAATFTLEDNETATFQLKDDGDWLLTSLIGDPIILDGYHKDIVRTNSTSSVAPTVGEYPAPIDGSSATVKLFDGRIEHWNYNTTWALQYTDTGNGLFQYDSGVATIWATGTGVTFTKSGTGNSVNTFTVPTGVHVKRVTFNFTNTETDAGDLFVKFTFADARAYNVSYRTALVPSGGVFPSNQALPLATPVNIVHFSQNAANGDKIMQVSELAGGTGSDIEFKFQGMNSIATSNDMFLDFGNF